MNPTIRDISISVAVSIFCFIFLWLVGPGSCICWTCP